ncbi:MAG: hypothetical protein ACYC6T_00525 [Thermoleophilia bacterium]
MRVHEERGSVLLTALLVSLGTALLVVALAGAVSLAQAGREAEAEGRRLMSTAGRGLAHARFLAERAWEPSLEEGIDGLTVTLSPISGASGRLLRATATVRGLDSTCAVSAVVERGVDGVDLPWRAAAVGSLEWDMSRADPLVSRETAPVAPEEVFEGGEVIEGCGLPRSVASSCVTVARVGSTPLLGENVVLETGRSWTLDAGTRALAETSPAGALVLPVPTGVSVRQALSLDGRPQLGLSGEMPVVLVGVGPGPLDATGLGELYAVLLSGSGGVQLDGTQLHGAVFTEGGLWFGSTGRIVFDEDVLEWAQHRSITRVRLVPGTREEGFRAAGD